jgi:PAS domain S-box-containing protein
LCAEAYAAGKRLAGGSCGRRSRAWREADDRPDLAQIERERRRAEEELRRTGALLRAVADEVSDAISVKDRDGKYLLLNQAASWLTGKSAAEVLGRDDTAILDLDSARAVMARDRSVMAAGMHETEEEELTAAGVTRTYLATKAPYRDERGNVVGVIGISRDITERNRAEEALRSSERNLALLRKSERSLREAEALGHTGSWEQDLITGEIFNTEENLRLFFGDDRSKGERLEDYIEVVHPDDRDRVAHRRAQLLSEGGPRDIEFRVVWPDGSVHVLFGLATVVQTLASPQLFLGPLSFRDVHVGAVDADGPFRRRRHSARDLAGGNGLPSETVHAELAGGEGARGAGHLASRLTRSLSVLWRGRSETAPGRRARSTPCGLNGSKSNPYSDLWAPSEIGGRPLPGPGTIFDRSSC